MVVVEGKSERLKSAFSAEVCELASPLTAYPMPSTHDFDCQTFETSSFRPDFGADSADSCDI